MEAVTRLTKEYNVWKRAANRRRPMDEPNQLPPTDQQLQAETWKRKVTNGALENELRDGLKDDLESALWNGLVGNLTDFNVARVEEVDKHRQQQTQSQETEKLAQRNTAITEYMDKLRVTQAATPHRRNEVQAIRQAVERRLREHYRNYSIEVHLFGSFASGLCSMSSDADMTVYNLHVASPHCPPIVELAASLRRIGYQRVTSIPHARVPIASWKLYGIQCDANLNQPLGVHNSKLISTYSKIDDRFKTLWFSIKQIGLQHGIISASTGFLSSYALTMMLVVFLQDITSPTILPRLQQSPHATLHTIDGYDCSFDSKINYSSYGADNTNSAGQLLIDFFYFYGYVFDYANQEVHPSLGKIQNRSITPPARSRTDSRPKGPFVAGKSGTQDYNYLLHDLATTFAHVRQMFLNKPHSKFSDMATYIQTHGLHNTAALKRSLPALCHDSSFPYKTPVKSRPGQPQGVNEYIYLPPLGSRQINEFLQKYADDVPSEYQDEIAAVIYYLRVNCWTNRRGSGGYASYLADGSLGVTKYSKEHNAKKRQRTVRAQARELEQQKALIRQLQVEEEKAKARQEAEKRERELARLQVAMGGMSLAHTQPAERLRTQQLTEDVRYRSINRYLDQLRLQAATAGTRRNVEMLRQALETLLRRHHRQPQAEVCLFGSFESGLSTLTSDADFTVLNFRDLGREPIHELASNLQDSGWGPIKTIANARVPIVSFTGHGIRCDMSINQPMGVFNSQLINAYQRIDSRFLGTGGQERDFEWQHRISLFLRAHDDVDRVPPRHHPPTRPPKTPTTKCG
ncbi:hypothetical protein BGZ89_001341 [Linnemannia elongata]|nr:hypothetical protein BGZ89_001341 [Linnemannia elongata]